MVLALSPLYEPLHEFVCSDVETLSGNIFHCDAHSARQRAISHGICCVILRVISLRIPQIRIIFQPIPVQAFFRNIFQAVFTENTRGISIGVEDIAFRLFAEESAVKASVRSSVTVI